MYDQVIATGFLGWWVAVTIVTTIGSVQILRHYSRPRQRSISSRLQHQDVPHVTVVRPCKGLEPFLYECLAAIFHQDYPPSRFTVHFCVASRSDEAYPILEQLLKDYPKRDAKIYIEEEDPGLLGQNGERFGPNPKIRNMSRAYREAKGDIIWIMDCNIWAGYGVLGRMVDKLCGFSSSSHDGKKAQTERPYNFVAHVPISIDADKITDHSSRPRSISAADDASGIPFLNSGNARHSDSQESSPSLTGSMLDATFLSTAHAKFFVAINTVSIAPCINGKSAMLRKSHLDHATQGQGIDRFSHNICEDHLMADILWKTPIPSTFGFDDKTLTDEAKKCNPNVLDYCKPGLTLGDFAIQPVAGYTISSYIARRVRWLRVRKFTVPAATLVEPGTESIACSAMGAYAATTLPRLQPWFGTSWLATATCFTCLMLYWASVDWVVSGTIQGMGSIETKETRNQESSSDDQNGTTIPISLPPFVNRPKRHFTTWLRAWLGREILALPIWTWAIWGGTQVTWRDKRFRVGMDTKVHEVPDRTR